MLKLFLRYQFRNKQAFFFLSILVIFAIRQGGMMQTSLNPYIYAFLISNYFFTNIISQCKIPLPLLYITNTNMVKVVRGFNISLFVWLNLTDAIINGYNLFYKHTPLLSCVRELVTMNLSLFIAFVVGNRISFSDLFTMKSRTWSQLAVSSLFMILVIPGPAFLSFFSHKWPVIIYISAGLLLLFITIWWFDSKRYTTITQFSHFIAGYDNDTKN